MVSYHQIATKQYVVELTQTRRESEKVSEVIVP